MIQKIGVWSYMVTIKYLALIGLELKQIDKMVKNLLAWVLGWSIKKEPESKSMNSLRLHSTMLLSMGLMKYFKCWLIRKQILMPLMLWEQLLFILQLDGVVKVLSNSSWETKEEMSNESVYMDHGCLSIFQDL